MPDHHVQGLLHIVEILEALLADGRTVLIGHAEGIYIASCSAGRHAVESLRKGRHASATSLEGALEDLTESPRSKVCLGCSQEKRLWCFGPDKDAADGRSARCRACEAKRIGAITRRKQTKPPGAAGGSRE